MIFHHHSSVSQICRYAAQNSKLENNDWVTTSLAAQKKSNINWKMMLSSS
jgi:hypothetical protein